MEIGGYLQLEELKGREYYEGLQKLNLARTAMLRLMQVRGYQKLYLPLYLCDSMRQACENAGYAYELYDLNDDCEPVLDFPEGIRSDEAVLIVNYYGQLSDARVQSLGEKYRNVIFDYTQCFFLQPPAGFDTINSCRKFIGVSDGAYVSSEVDVESGLERDISNGRMTHILGRYEENAGKYYQNMLDVAYGFADTPVRRMSKLTENLLRVIDYEEIKKRRRENYEVLHEMLASDHPLNKKMPEVPFAYPFYHKNGIALRKELAARGIFVPTYWPFLLEKMPEGSREYDWSANVLPLPLDQRYTKDDMKVMADIICGVCASFGGVSDAP